MDTSKNIYIRLSNRHKWICIAVCHNDRAELIRQAYLASKDFPSFSLAWIEEETDFTFPDDKKSNFPGMHKFQSVDLATAEKLWAFVNDATLPISEDIVKPGIELGLLENSLLTK